MDRSVRNTFALTTLLLTVGGCRGSGTTIQSTSSDDDGDKSSSWVRIADGDGRFECRDSVTGSCNYVLYVQQCAPDAPLAGCSARVIRSFTLTAGKSREEHGLPPQVRVCQDHRAMPVAPDCAR